MELVDSVQIDPKVQVQVYENLIAQNAIQVAKLEASVQSLSASNRALSAEVRRLTALEMQRGETDAVAAD